MKSIGKSTLAGVIGLLAGSGLAWANLDSGGGRAMVGNLQAHASLGSPFTTSAVTAGVVDVIYPFPQVPDNKGNGGAGSNTGGGGNGGGSTGGGGNGGGSPASPSQIAVGSSGGNEGRSKKSGKKSIAKKSGLANNAAAKSSSKKSKDSKSKNSKSKNSKKPKKK